MENQNPHQEPIQPDYRFITEQQAPEPQRKTHAKKVYVLFGLVIILVLVTGVALIAGQYKDTSPQTFSTNVSQQTSQKFIDDVKAGQYQSAASILPKVEGRDNVVMLQTLFQKLDPQSCVIESTKQDSEVVNYVTIKCDRNDDAYSMKIEFEFVKDNNNSILRQYVATAQKN